MKAALYTGYGTPDVVRIMETEKPVPEDNEVLIRVRAAAVNPLDSHLMRGKPYLMRLAFGLRRPNDPRIGRDVAGEVESLGRSVTGIKPGDEVFGACRGALAEHACIAESALALKPRNITFEQAAATPIAALTALQGLREYGHIRGQIEGQVEGQTQAAQKVLINGASGGVGTFAVQIAKAFGAEVTAVCGTSNVEMLRSLGADHVIDYTREDFTTGRERYDLVFDLVSNHSLRACRRVLSVGGAYVGAGALGGQGMLDFAALMIKPAVFSPLISQRMVAFVAKARRADLILIARLMESGQVTPVIDRCYSLSEAAEAIRYVAEKHARGKVAIAVP